MITEPEMWDEPEQDRPADLLSDDDHRPGSGSGAKRRRRVWALGGIALASLTWAAVLQGIGYGHPDTPDLHGYHLIDTPCTVVNLAPLTDTISAGGFTQDSRTPPHLGQGLDHTACTATSSVSIGEGWSTAYGVAVSIDLHRKTDPRAEFVDTYGSPAAARATVYETDGTVFRPAPGAVTETYPGLGDLAYATGSANRQTLSVLHGGAVISVTVDAANTWRGVGSRPANADGTPRRPPLVDTTALRPLLVRTVRHLMAVLAN